MITLVKKQLSKIPELKEKVLKQAASPALGEYVWTYGAGPQMGYSFSKIHALAYSMIGAQTLYIATNWNPIYWNTACLIVNSGALEDNSEEEIVDIYAPEQDDLANGVTFVDSPDKKTKVRKTASTDYTKIAKAIGDIRKAEIKVSLIDINNSNFGFKPDVKNNQILYGFKAIQGVGDDLVNRIIENRPYLSMMDFFDKVHPTRSAMIALIKSGAFDTFEDRRRAMVEYIWMSCDKKKRLTLQNIPGLIKHNMLPETNEEEIMARRIYEFNRYLKAECKYNDKCYKLDDRAVDFLSSIDYDCGDGLIEIKSWDKYYKNWMEVFKSWIAADKDKILDTLNTEIFMDDWRKYAKGNISSWEMEVLCFYYHEHELAHVDNSRYGFSDFYKLSEEPEVEKFFKKNNAQIPIFKLNTICGTCVAKNKTKSIVYLLTTSGIVTVKFNKEYFSMFDRQISERQEDGTKKVIEKSWFNRGSMIIVQGIRRESEFVAKNYASSNGHQLYKIDQVLSDNSLVIRHERMKGEEEDEENIW